LNDAHGLDYQLIFEIFHFTFDTAVAIYVYIANKNKATNERINGIEKSVDDELRVHSERLARLEEGADALPTHKDLSDLHTRINSLSADVSSMGGEMKSMGHVLQLIHQHLLSGAAR
jgi:hypothetical protein